MSSLSSLRRALRPKRMVAGLAVLVVGAVLIGASSEQLARGNARRQFPVLGRLVDVGGRRIQIDCRGAGSPTVVFESGLDLLGSLSWAAVHDSVAKTTRACAYSRAGIMWSDPSFVKFTSTEVARDLYATLGAAGESAPFVMVGHSIGGPYVMTFTGLFGADVAGVVLVDASHPDQLARLEKAVGAPMTPPTGVLAFGSAVARTGLLRFVVGDIAPQRAPRFVHEATAAYVPTSLASGLHEVRALPLSLVAAGRFRDLGDRPLVVLTAAGEMTAAELEMQHMSREQASAFRAEWKDLQHDQSTWSRHAHQVLLTDARHYIQFDQPSVVIAAVREVVCAVRAEKGTACQPCGRQR